MVSRYTQLNLSIYPFCMGLPVWINWISISCSLHHQSNSLDVNSGSLFVLMTRGLPRHAITLSRVLIMRLKDSEVSISMGNASRIQSSITLKIWNWRTPMMLSLINPCSSYDWRLQLAEGAVELGPANVAFLWASDSFWGVIHFGNNTELLVWKPVCRPWSPVLRERVPILRLFAAWWQGPAYFFESRSLNNWLSIAKSAYILLSRECSSTRVLSFCTSVTSTPRYMAFHL